MSIRRIPRVTRASLVVATIVTLLLFAWPTDICQAQEVFVRADEEGAGLLHPREADCLLVVPDHVTRNAGSVTVVGDLRTETKAELIRRFPPQDIALFKIANEKGLGCREWMLSDTLSTVLRNVTDGILKRRRADGGMAQTPVFVVGYNDQTIEIAPRLANATIVRTMSGSTLYLAGELAGILDSASNGHGIVSRIDRVYTTIRSLLESTGSAPLSPGQQVKSSLDRFSLDHDGRRASVSVTIENKARTEVGIALEHNGQTGVFAGPKVSLSDDNAKTWFVESSSGVREIPCCDRSLEGLTPESFTSIPPGRKVHLLVIFTNDNNGMGTVQPYRAPGASIPKPTIYSFTADLLFYTAAGVKRLTIQFPSIGGHSANPGASQDSPSSQILASLTRDRVPPQPPSPPPDAPVLRPASADVDTELSKLAFLRGCWLGRLKNGEITIQETWSTRSDGTWVATTLYISGGGIVGRETSSIEARNDGMAFLASSNGSPPETYSLMAASTDSVVFENPLKATFPSRVRYRRTASGGLSVTNEGLNRPGISITMVHASC